MRLQPDNATAYSNLGFAYDKLGKLPEAIAALQNAVRLKPDDAVAYNNLGASFYKAGRYPEAIEAFTKAVRLNPKDPEALNNLGAVYYITEEISKGTRKLPEGSQRETRLRRRSIQSWQRVLHVGKEHRSGERLPRCDQSCVLTILKRGRILEVC